jgi:hypothetical protein
MPAIILVTTDIPVTMGILEAGIPSIIITSNTLNMTIMGTIMDPEAVVFTEIPVTAPV